MQAMMIEMKCRCICMHTSKSHTGFDYDSPQMYERAWKAFMVVVRPSGELRACVCMCVCVVFYHCVRAGVHSYSHHMKKREQRKNHLPQT